MTATRTSLRRFISPVHVFEYRGNAYAFFVQMSRMTRLEPAAAVAMRAVESGEFHADREAVGERLRDQFGTEMRDRVLDDLAVLECSGYLDGDIRDLSPRERRRDINGMLRHQPRNLMFFVTEACNLACTYCYEKNQGVHDQPAIMKREDSRRIIDRYLEGSLCRQALSITFFGGEPLLNPKLIQDAVAYAKQRAQELGKEIGFTMTSNLTLLTPEMSEFLAKERFHVMVSLDGDREANDRYRVMRDGSGTYDKVVANLRMLIDSMRKYKTRLPKIRATMTAENSDPVAVDRHLRSLGTHLVEVGETHGTVDGREEFDVTHPIEGETESPIQKHIEEVLQALAKGGAAPQLTKMVREGLTRSHEHLTRAEPHGPPRPKLCGVWRNMKAVTPDGGLFPCHRYVGMDAFRFGNMHQDGVDPNRLRGYYDKVYDAFADKCAPCWLRYICGGQCPWYLSNEDGSISSPDEQTCNTMRRAHERNLGLYATLASDHPSVLASVLNIRTDGPATPGNGDTPGNAPDQSCGI